MKVIDDILGGIESACGILFLAGMVVIIFIQVILRFCFGTALSWSEELARYLMIWCTGFGISASVRAGSNIGIQALVDALPQGPARIVRFICEVLTLVVFVFLTYASALFTVSAVTSGQLTPSMRIPIYYVYAALPVTFAFGVIRQIQVLLDTYFSGKDTLPPVQSESETRTMQAADQDSATVITAVEKDEKEELEK